MSSNLATNTYRQIEVNGSNRLQLVVMLYDGAIRFLGEAKACLAKNDTRGRNTAINRTLAILGELQSTLKMEEGGEVARSLDKLYNYMTSRILDSNLKGIPNGFDESIHLLRIVNSAWTQIANQPEQPTTPSGQPAPIINRPPERPANASLELFG
jgi:flagellar secretion chaperone FliS